MKRSIFEGTLLTDFMTDSDIFTSQQLEKAVSAWNFWSRLKMSPAHCQISCAVFPKNLSKLLKNSLNLQINIFIFLAVVFILLINLLIAMMGDTYGFVASIPNEWMRQWARTVLIVERGISPKERLRQQDLYAERMQTGEKALVLKQTMSVSFKILCLKFKFSKNKKDLSVSRFPARLITQG